MADVSQHETILKMLRKAGMRGVANYSFPQQRILRYSSRIKELRDEGFNIIVEREKLPNGRYTNVYWYTLIEEKKKSWWKK